MTNGLLVEVHFESAFKSLGAGPLWSKNGDAAAYAYVAQNNMSLDSSLPDARRIPLASGCTAVISYDVRNETANIAFAVGPPPSLLPRPCICNHSSPHVCAW